MVCQGSALIKPVILSKITQEFWGAVVGQGRGQLLRSPGKGVAAEDSLPALYNTPPSLPEGVSAKTTFQGKKAHKSNKQSRK